MSDGDIRINLNTRVAIAGWQAERWWNVMINESLNTQPTQTLSACNKLREIGREREGGEGGGERKGGERGGREGKREIKFHVKTHRTR